LSRGYGHIQQSIVRAEVFGVYGVYGAQRKLDEVGHDFYKTAASPDGLWWVRFQKKNDKMHRNLRSIGLLCCL
jgi:hypothetical protein